MRVRLTRGISRVVRFKNQREPREMPPSQCAYSRKVERICIYLLFTYNSGLRAVSVCRRRAIARDAEDGTRMLQFVELSKVAASISISIRAVIQARAPGRGNIPPVRKQVLARRAMRKRLRLNVQGQKLVLYSREIETVEADLKREAKSKNVTLPTNFKLSADGGDTLDAALARFQANDDTELVIILLDTSAIAQQPVFVDGSADSDPTTIAEFVKTDRAKLFEKRERHFKEQLGTRYRRYDVRINVKPEGAAAGSAPVQVNGILVLTWQDSDAWAGHPLPPLRVIRVS